MHNFPLVFRALDLMKAFLFLNAAAVVGTSAGGFVPCLNSQFHLLP
jgi:hypothetical protein